MNDGNTSAVRSITVTENTTLTAMFIKKQYAVTLKLNDNNMGSVEGAGTYESGTEVTIKAIAEEGHHFVQWSDGSKDAERVITVSKNTTLTARFAIDVYSIKVSENDASLGAAIGSGSYKYGASVTIQAWPYTGSSFVEWSDGSKDAVRSFTATSNVDLVATFAVETYTVRFVDYDGKELSKQTVAFGEDAEEPAEPTREGYTFTGWDSDWTLVISDLTINATYVVNNYKVAFVDYDGKTLSEQTVSYGASATAPVDPEREGYSFTGWDVDYSDVKSDITVKATYAVLTYTVTFVDFNNKVLDQQTVEYGASATAPADPERKGFLFTGWEGDYRKMNDLTSLERGVYVVIADGQKYKVRVK